MKDLINLTSKKNIYFISPHLDDAILSCGQLISYLSSHSKVTVISVFTKIHYQKPTFSARQFIKQCGYNSAKKLQGDRIKEDKEILERIGCHVIHLDYIDALWRKKPCSKKTELIERIIPEISHVYPTYRWHLKKGKISKYDNSLINDLSQKLKQIISSKHIIFCPIAIGNHIDHKITKIACQNIFDEIIFWSDFPYNRKETTIDKLLDKNNINNQYIFIKNKPEKIKLICGYKSQQKLLFNNNEINLIPERYYHYKKQLNEKT